jgi:hypothetical protein
MDDNYPQWSIELFLQQKKSVVQFYFTEIRFFQFVALNKQIKGQKSGKNHIAISNRLSGMNIICHR